MSLLWHRVDQEDFHWHFGITGIAWRLTHLALSYRGDTLRYVKVISSSGGGGVQLLLLVEQEICGY